MTKNFDSDTDALIQREQVNTRGALYDLEDWIIDQVRPYEGMKILDVGCGTGKQIFAFAIYVYSAGENWGLDISDKAVEAVNERARQEGMKQIRAIQGPLDKGT